MEWVQYIIDFVMHIDVHLGAIIKDYGIWTYLILFMIIFCETGLVVTPVLPGDSQRAPGMTYRPPFWRKPEVKRPPLPDGRATPTRQGRNQR